MYLASCLDELFLINRRRFGNLQMVFYRVLELAIAPKRPRAMPPAPLASARTPAEPRAPPQRTAREELLTWVPPVKWTTQIGLWTLRHACPRVSVHPD